MANGEAREHRRARARVKVEYHFGTTTATGECSDITEGGMFLACHKVAPLGTRVYLRVHIPGTRAGDPLKIIGIVTRTSDEAHPDVTGSPPGMALHFEVAYARTREQLSEFMGQLLQHGEPTEAAPPKDIRLLAGSTEERRTYAARFPPPEDEAYSRLDTLRPPDVERVFSFDANGTDKAHHGPHARLEKSVVLSLILVVVVLGLIAYALAVYTGNVR